MRCSAALLVLVSFAIGCGEKQDPAGDADFQIDCGVTYTEHVKPILDANCISCHASNLEGADRNGAPEGIDFDSYGAAKASGDEANTRIQAGVFGMVMAQDPFTTRRTGSRIVLDSKFEPWEVAGWWSYHQPKEGACPLPWLRSRRRASRTCHIPKPVPNRRASSCPGSPEAEKLDRRSPEELGG